VILYEKSFAKNAIFTSQKQIREIGHKAGSGKLT